MSLQRTSRLSPMFLALAFSVSCKTTHDSALNEYEKPEHAGQNICDLVKAEASAHVKERNQPFEVAYKEVFYREAAVFTLMVPKARLCNSERARTEPKPGTPPPHGSAGDAGTPSVASGIDPSTSFPAVDDPECEGFRDGARLPDLEMKLRQLSECDPATHEIENPDVPPQQFSLADGTPVTSDICAAIGVDRKECQGLVGGTIALGKASLDKLCSMAGAALNAQKIGKYDSAAAQECGAEVVMDVCFRHSAVTAAIAHSANDGAKRMNEKVQSVFQESVKQLGSSFSSSIVKCATAYGKEAVKDLVKGAAKDVATTAFSRSLTSTESFLANGRYRAIIGVACAAGAGIAGATMGKYEAHDLNAECKDLWAGNKQRALACVSTVKEIGCDSIAGEVDITDSLHITDENQAARLFADVTNGAIAGACYAAGANVGSAACSLIAKSSGYIVDALKGKSNPWADCLGTPAMGACVADKWHEWSTGIKPDDYKVGIVESAKKPDEKYYGNVCWCWRKCMSDDWGTDREIHKDLYWERASVGEAGARLCASKERELKWPERLTYENGRRNAYIQYTSCGVNAARGPAPNLWTDKGFMEIQVAGRWGWYQFPRNEGDHYMGCGGKADGGI